MSVLDARGGDVLLTVAVGAAFTSLAVDTDTGRVFIVGGGDVYLVQNFTATNHIAKDGRWTVEELRAHKGKLLEGEAPGVPARTPVGDL